jgi:uncharacterized protein (TIGR02246 family)
MKSVFVTLTIAFALVMVGPLVHAQPPNVRTAIDAGNQQFMAAVQKGDAAALAALYTVDGQTFPPNADVVHGRDAIQAMWQSVIQSGIGSAKLVTREMDSSGDLAWETGNYELFTKDNTSADHGKYVVVWKRVQGNWQLHRDIWNSSVAPKQ